MCFNLEADHTDDANSSTDIAFMLLLLTFTIPPLPGTPTGTANSESEYVFFLADCCCWLLRPRLWKGIRLNSMISSLAKESSFSSSESSSSRSPSPCCCCSSSDSSGCSATIMDWSLKDSSSAARRDKTTGRLYAADSCFVGEELHAMLHIRHVELGTPFAFNGVRDLHCSKCNNNFFVVSHPGTRQSATASHNGTCCKMRVVCTHPKTWHFPKHL